MPFPEVEMSYGGTYACIVGLNNQLFLRRVVPIYGRLFFVKELGVYQMHEEYRYVMNRAEIYFFSQKGANPLSLQAVVNLNGWLEAKGMQELSIEDLGMIVDKFRRVEIMKTMIKNLKQKAVTEKEIIELLRDGTLPFTIGKLDAAMPRDLEGLDHKTRLWLNAYFREDVTARYYLSLRMITDTNYKLPDSPPVRAIMPLQKTMGKQNIALIVVNNARIVVDSDVKVDMDYAKGHYVLHTKQYGDFDIVEAKTRYKYGRQNIFIVMVETGLDIPKTEPLPEEPAKVEPVKPVPVEQPKEVKPVKPIAVPLQVIQ